MLGELFVALERILVIVVEEQDIVSAREDCSIRITIIRIRKTN